MKYIFLVGFSALFFVLIELLYKFSGCSKMKTDLFVAVWFIICGLVAIPYYFAKKFNEESIPYDTMMVIVLMSIFTFIGNIFYWDACRYLSNPGIARTVFSGVLILLLSLISAIIFNNYLSVKQSGSILLILFGIGSLLMSD
jgi:multidrug transporter EmrE-like cation transporter